MGDDLKEEVPVSAVVNELVLREGSQRKTAQDKGPGVKCHFLLTLFALFANEYNGVQLLYPPA